MRGFLVTVLLAAHSWSLCQELSALPGTSPLDWSDEDFSVRIMDGAHAFVEREIAEALHNSPALPRDPEAREAYLAQSRLALAKKIGVVDERLPVRLEFYSDDPVGFEGEPTTALVAETPEFRAHAFRWTVLEEFQVEGLYVNPVAEAATVTSPPLCSS